MDSPLIALSQRVFTIIILLALNSSYIFKINIKNFVMPTGLEPVISTVKGWCPNQLDDGTKLTLFIDEKGNVKTYIF